MLFFKKKIKPVYPVCSLATFYEGMLVREEAGWT